MSGENQLKLLQREQRSLFGEILDWMITPLLVLWPASMVLTWLVAQTIANKPFDRALEENLLAISQFAQAKGNKAIFNLPAPVSSILRADEDDQIFFQVLGLRGEYLSGDRDLPLPAEDTSTTPGVIQLRDDELRGLDLRVAWMYVALQGAGLPKDAKPILIQVAETRNKRSRLAAEIVRGVMLPQFFIMPLAVLLVWMALARGLRPLHELQERIRARRTDDLSPIDTQEVPAEVAPLVASINELFRREREALLGQKRFLANAAHQLKTPLAGLRMQAELALKPGTKETDLKQSLQLIIRSSMRATRTVNQLLALARAESEGQGMPMQSLDLAQIVMEVVRDALPRAMERGIDLGYEGPAPGDPVTQLMGSATLLAELVRNLVDNAIHYMPSSQRHGVITVRIVHEPVSEMLILQVEDNGLGIAPAERVRVLQPFYRSLGQDADGSGLGLAIVDEIARRHGASLSMEDTHPSQEHPGLRFCVRFLRSQEQLKQDLF